MWTKEQLIQACAAVGTHVDDQGNKIIVKPYGGEPLNVGFVDATGWHYANIGDFPKHEKFIIDYYFNQVRC